MSSSKKDRQSRRMFKNGVISQQDFDAKFWDNFGKAESEMQSEPEPVKPTGFQPTLYAKVDDLGSALKKSGFNVVQAETEAGEEVKRNLFYIRNRGQQ